MKLREWLKDNKGTKTPIEVHCTRNGKDVELATVNVFTDDGRLFISDGADFFGYEKDEILNSEVVNHRLLDGEEYEHEILGDTSLRFSDYYGDDDEVYIVKVEFNNDEDEDEGEDEEI